MPTNPTPGQRPVTPQRIREIADDYMLDSSWKHAALIELADWLEQSHEQPASPTAQARPSKYLGAFSQDEATFLEHARQ